jgi:hypothetical protein
VSNVKSVVLGRRGGHLHCVIQLERPELQLVSLDCRRIGSKRVWAGCQLMVFVPLA